MYKKSTSGQKFKKKWEKRRQNKLKYILIHGVLINSLFMGNFMYWFLSLVQEIPFNIRIYVIWIIAGAIGGIIFGIMQFKNNEIKYHQILKWEQEEQNNKINQNS